jgi:hypothetical protein
VGAHGSLRYAQAAVDLGISTPDNAGLSIRRTSDSGHATRLPTLRCDRSHHQPKEIIMNGIRHIRRLAGLVAGLAAVLLASAAAVPAAFAATNPIPDPPGYVGDPYIGTAPVAPVPATTVHVINTGGMPGWQITLIAIGAALLAATVAVLLDRARATRRNPATAAT